MTGGESAAEKQEHFYNLYMLTFVYFAHWINLF